MAVTIFKEIVEVALPARMMFTISVANVFVYEDEERGKEKLEKMRGLLKFACLQPIERLPMTTRKVAAKHIDRLHAKVMGSYENQRADKVATAIYYFLKHLTDTGYLELWEGSPVAEAAELYLPMIEHVFEETKLDASAQKQARRILSKLQEMGYYV